MSASKAGWVTSRPVSVIIGAFAGGLTVLLLESAGHALFGTADPADFASVSMPQFLSVLVAWIVGAGVGAAVATAWAKTGSIVPGVVAGSVLLAATVANLIAIPHPIWMAVAAVVLIPVAALGASRAVARRRSPV